MSYSSFSERYADFAPTDEAKAKVRKTINTLLELVASAEDRRAVLDAAIEVAAADICEALGWTQDGLEGDVSNALWEARDQIEEAKKRLGVSFLDRLSPDVFAPKVMCEVAVMDVPARVIKAWKKFGVQVRGEDGRWRDALDLTDAFEHRSPVPTGCRRVKFWSDPMPVDVDASRVKPASQGPRRAARI